MKKTICCMIAISALLAVPASAAVVSHWTFDSDYTDSTGTNDGTLVDTVTTGNAVIDTTTKKFGAGSFAMGDNQDRTSISETVLTNDADGYAVSLWLKQTASNDSGIAIGQGGPTNLMWKNNARYFFKANDQQVLIDLTGDTEWHHMVFVNNAGSGSTLYVDNVAQTDVLDQAFTFDRLGAGYTMWGLVGNLDEVWIFDSALSGAEVSSLYNSNVVPEPATMSLLALGGIAMLKRKRK